MKRAVSLVAGLLYFLALSFEVTFASQSVKTLIGEDVASRVLRVEKVGDCHESQSCLYQRANDLMSVQAQYMCNLAQELKRLKTTNARDPGLKETLDPFCRATKKNSPDCLPEYLQAVIRSMQLIRKDLIRNAESIAMLSGASPAGRSEVSKPLTGGSSSIQPNIERVLGNPKELERLKLYPDFPLMPAFEAIDPVVKALADTARQQLSLRSQQQGQAGGSLQDEALARWWDTYPKCPSPDEFTVVEQIERYPSQPTGEKLTVVKVDAQGRPIIDMKRYQAAQKGCSGAIQSHFKELPLEFVDQGHRAQALSKQIYQKMQQGFVNEARRKWSSEASSRNKGLVQTFSIDLLVADSPKGNLSGSVSQQRQLGALDECIEELSKP